MAKRWVRKTDLLTIRPAKDREMVAAGQFSRDGDMIIVRKWPDDDFLIAKRDLKDYVEVEVPDEKGN